MPHLCRACSGTLRWVEMESGRHLPVDPVPTPRTGDIAARLVGNRYVAGYKISRLRPLLPGYTRFDSHYRTCDMKPRPSLGHRAVPQPLPIGDVQWPTPPSTSS